MGTLILPASGMIYADAQIAIYGSDHHPLYGPVCAPVWQVSGALSVVSSELILLETLSRQLRQNAGKSDCIQHQAGCPISISSNMSATTSP